MEDTKEYDVVAKPEVDEISEALNGYVLDPAGYPNNAAGLKTTEDGTKVLIPQPSGDKDDPLNWSSRKKTVILVVVTYIAFLADYAGSCGILPVLPQAVEWQMTQVSVQRAVTSCIFMIGASGLFMVIFASYFGRLPATLVFQAIFFAAAAWCASATSFGSYLGGRIILGLFSSAGQGGALLWVKDMYYFHEHPKKINYVEMGIIVSPYLGPMISAFIVDGTTWRWTFWVCTILNGIALLSLLLIDETLYDRSIPDEQGVSRGPYWQRLLGIQQAKSGKHRSFFECVMRPLIAMTKIPFVLIIVYYFLNFAWVISVNTTVSICLTEYYGFTPRDIGFFYFFGLVGPLLGWLLGHFLHDLVGKIYAKRHNGHIDPEARLLIAYPATMLLFACLLIIGYALANRWHYMVLAVFAALQTVGIMVITTATNAYLLDAYPEGSGEIAAWTSAGRNWSGFMATYVQIEWVTRTGPVGAFASQAGITVASIILLLVIQVLGKRLRKMQGRMDFGKSAKAH